MPENAWSWQMWVLMKSYAWYLKSTALEFKKKNWKPFCEQKLWDTFIPQGPKLSESEKQVFETVSVSSFCTLLQVAAAGAWNFQCNRHRYERQSWLQWISPMVCDLFSSPRKVTCDDSVLWPVIKKPDFNCRPNSVTSFLILIYCILCSGSKRWTRSSTGSRIPKPQSSARRKNPSSPQRGRLLNEALPKGRPPKKTPPPPKRLLPLKWLRLPKRRLPRKRRPLLLRRRVLPLRHPLRSASGPRLWQPTPQRDPRQRHRAPHRRAQRAVSCHQIPTSSLEFGVCSRDSLRAMSCRSGGVGHDVGPGTPQGENRRPPQLRPGACPMLISLRNHSPSCQRRQGTCQIAAFPSQHCICCSAQKGALSATVVGPHFRLTQRTSDLVRGLGTLRGWAGGRGRGGRASHRRWTCAWTCASRYCCPDTNRTCSRRPLWKRCNGHSPCLDMGPEYSGSGVVTAAGIWIR